MKKVIALMVAGVALVAVSVNIARADAGDAFLGYYAAYDNPQDSVPTASVSLMSKFGKLLLDVNVYENPQSVSGDPLEGRITEDEEIFIVMEAVNGASGCRMELAFKEMDGKKTVKVRKMNSECNTYGYRELLLGKTLGKTTPCGH